LHDSKVRFLAFQDTLNIAIINGVFEGGKWKTEGYGVDFPSYKEKEALRGGKTLSIVSVYGRASSEEGYYYKVLLLAVDGKQLFNINLYGPDRLMKNELLRWKNHILENMKNLKNKQ